MSTGFMTLTETAAALQVSERHARRLADTGALTRVAHGLVDRDSVDRYLASHRQGRTRAWAEHTAWAAIALLAGADAGWLGTSQTSRLRGALRRIEEPDELLTRVRDRARTRPFAAHRSALPRLRDIAATTDLGRIGLVDLAAHDNLDGYIAASDLDAVVRSLGMRAGNGNVVLRVTAFDIAQVRELVEGSGLVTAIDAAESLDPRTRGVGLRAIEAALAAYR